MFWGSAVPRYYVRRSYGFTFWVFLFWALYLGLFFLSSAGTWAAVIAVGLIVAAVFWIVAKVTRG
ncbi:hypothetical protein; putative signal peptide [Frankia alni ACN14a]|uniref:Uncharacterized protein n=1 Tax=Frankia alni (strain DSM 45986 / CECT 9034 / ACN14a) TaxID=326424 RepID=Q0RLM4_FRAAA|nr:hypothetical protein; putative signal peptide [Frankia alni ACN14a]